VRIKVKKYAVADLASLTRLVLQFIYEKDKMPLERTAFMEHSIVAWGKKLQNDKERNALIPGYEPDYAEQLQWLGGMLKKDAEHEFDERKRMFSYHGIDYKKFHRLPGSNTEKDKALAQQVYAAYKAKNLEQEGG
jgi:hypothetical protein